MALAPQQQPGPLETDLIPPAARANAAAADAMIAALAAGQQVGQPEVVAQPVVAPPPAAPPQEPPPLPVTPPQTQAPLIPASAPLIDPNQATPEQLNQASIEEILAMQAEPGSPAAKLQHAYKSALGRERVRRQQDADRIRQLTEELQARAANPPPPRNFDLPPQTPEEQLIEAGATEEEVANFGDEMTAMVARIATGAAKAEAERLRASLAPTIQQIGNMTAAERIDRMVTQLDANLVPWQVRFAQLNTYAPFLAWLALPDAMSGATRHKLLEAAWNSHDGSRVWAICSSFLNEHDPRSPAPQPPPAPNGSQPPVSLESLAAPGRGPRAIPPNDPQAGQKPHYTKAEVAAFYTAKRLGKYTPEEAAVHEAEIFAAGREGRIH